MAYSSAHISGLIGGQQAMFSNQAAYSQQLGGIYGTGPTSPGPMAQNPYPSYGAPGYGQSSNFGAGMASGVGDSVPGLATMASIGGGLAGGRLGYLDPFTSMFRGFSAGSGAGRMAGMNMFGHLGKTFASGGLRAGLGAIGGGMAGAAMFAAPHMAAGAALSYAGGQISQGDETYQNVRNITNQMGPFYGTAGVRPGGKMASSQIEAITGVLQEMASESVLASVKTMTGLMDKFSQMGMLTGVTDPQSFQRKFSSLVKQVDSVAKIMGTSLEEAAPVLQNMRQMGLWTTQDVMGTAQAMRMVGPQGSAAMMGAMQTGAQQVWQQGGSMRAGATLARNQFLNVQAATRSGVLTDESIMGLTGGTGGVRGQAMVAQQMTSITSRMAQSPLGRMMSAGMAEVGEGGFTGGVDEEAFDQFMSGGLGVGDLESMGRKNASKGGLASLAFRKDQIGQELMSRGGAEGQVRMAKMMIDRVLRGHGDKSDGVKAMIVQKTFGLDRRYTELVMSQIDNMSKILEEKQRMAESAINDSFREYDIRMNRSFGGLSTSVGQGLERTVGTRFQGLGSRLSGKFEGMGESINDMIYGASAAPPMTQRKMINALARGGGGTGADLGLSEDQLSVFGGDLGENNLEWMRTGVTRGEMMSNLGVSGNDPTMREMAVRMGLERTQSRDPAALGYSSPSQQEDIGIVKQELRQLLMDPTTGSALERAKENADDSNAYVKLVASMVRGKGGRGAAAMSRLHRSMPGMRKEEGMRAAADMHAIAAASDDMPIPMGRSLEFTSGPLASMLRQTPEALSKIRKESLEDAADILTGGAWPEIGGAAAGVAGGVAGGAVGVWAGMAVASLGIPVIGPGLAAATSLGLGAYLAWKGFTGAGLLAEAALEDMTEKEVIDAMNNEEWGDLYIDWVKNDMPTDHPFIEATAKDSAASKIFSITNKIKKKDSKQFQGLKSALSKGDTSALIEAKSRRRQMLRDASKKELYRVKQFRKKKGLNQSIVDEYKEITDLYSGTDEDQAEATSRAQALGANLNRKQRNIFLKGGGAIGKQIGAFGLLGEFGTKESMTRNQYAEFEGRLQSTTGGTDITSDAGRRRIEELLKSGKGLDIDEMEEVQGILTGSVKRYGAVAGGQRGRQASQEKLLELLTTYTTVNTKFIHTAGAAISKISGKDMGELVTEFGDLTNQAKNAGVTV